MSRGVVEGLFLTVPWGGLKFMNVLFPDHSHLIFWMQIACLNIKLLRVAVIMLKQKSNGETQFKCHKTFASFSSKLIKI